MAVRLRLQRWGVANHPHYRIVAANQRAKRDGKYIELLGNYDPIPNPNTGLKKLQIKRERALYWIAVGAQPSDRVAWLMAKAGILPEPPIPTAKTISAQPKKKAQARVANKEAKEKKKLETEAKASAVAAAEAVKKASLTAATAEEESTKNKATSEEKPSTPEVTAKEDKKST